mmetsp:Transcript_111353/g.355307  ORF Transcript_111353/g.355307 Transcript_111353/m.355307 type:complete len:542 (+) Transcript_111353:48-1673(+)
MELPGEGGLGRLTSLPSQHRGLILRKVQPSHPQRRLAQAQPPAGGSVRLLRRRDQLEFAAEGQTASATHGRTQRHQDIAGRFQPAPEHLLLEHLLRQLALLRLGVGVGEKQRREATLVHLQAVRIHLLQPRLHLLEVPTQNVGAGHRCVHGRGEFEAVFAESPYPLLGGFHALGAHGQNQGVHKQRERLRVLLPLLNHAGEPFLCALHVARRGKGANDGRVRLGRKVHFSLQQRLGPVPDHRQLPVGRAVADEQRVALRGGLHPLLRHLPDQLLGPARVLGSDVAGDRQVVRLRVQLQAQALLCDGEPLLHLLHFAGVRKRADDAVAALDVGVDICQHHPLKPHLNLGDIPRLTPRIKQGLVGLDVGDQPNLVGLLEPGFGQLTALRRPRHADHGVVGADGRLHLQGLHAEQPPLGLLGVRPRGARVDHRIVMGRCRLQTRVDHVVEQILCIHRCALARQLLQLREMLVLGGAGLVHVLCVDRHAHPRHSSQCAAGPARGRAAAAGSDAESDALRPRGNEQAEGGQHAGRCGGSTRGTPAT